MKYCRKVQRLSSAKIVNRLEGFWFVVERECGCSLSLLLYFYYAKIIKGIQYSLSIIFTTLYNKISTFNINI